MTKEVIYGLIAIAIIVSGWLYDRWEVNVKTDTIVEESEVSHD